MTRTAHSSTVTVILAVAASGVLLIMAVLALLLTAHPARSTVAGLPTPGVGIFITAVPTVTHGLPAVSLPLPTPDPVALSQTNVDIQPASALPDHVPASESLAAPPRIPGPLVDPAFSLLRGPVAVPLEIQIPALKINAPVLGVGLTLANAMASPMGILADDPLWQTVFWYRGGELPGDIGTATFAGHFDDALGRPAIFAYLGDLRIGDLIVVRDTRSGLGIPFLITETKTYTDQESADPAVLARIFGSNAISGAEAKPAADQLSHLTLITCSGGWVNGSFNLRLVVYAIRASYPSGLGM